MVVGEGHNTTPPGGKSETMSFGWPHRIYESELMDTPTSDRAKLERTLNQFIVINWFFSNSRGLISKYIIQDIETQNDREFLTLLDVGSGACDIAIWLARKCKRLRITCLDHDPRVVEYAKRRCASQPAIEVVLGSASDLEDMETYDYIFANHFLHHLADEEIEPTFATMLKKSRRLFLINDLLRSPWAYLGFSIFSGLFLHRSFARADGLLSIKKGFRPEELVELTSSGDIQKRLEIFTMAPGHVCVVGR